RWPARRHVGRPVGTLRRRRAGRARRLKLRPLLFRLLLLPLRFEFARLFLAVPVELRLALERVATDLCRIVDRELLPVEFAHDLEGDFAVLVLGVLDLRLTGRAAGDRARELVAVELQLQDPLALLAAEVDRPLPRA